MGHALVAHYSENLDPVHRITIIPRGTAALGLTMTRPLEDRYLATEPELKDTLAFAMGGRVAEELVFGEISTGAQNDLEKATQIARAMVTEYGMSEKVGPLSLGHDDPNAFFGSGPKISSGTAELIDEEVSRLLGRGPRPGRAHPDGAPRAARPALRRAAAGGRDDRRRGPQGLRRRARSRSPTRRRSRARRSRPTKPPHAAAADARQAERDRGVRGQRIVMPPAPPMPAID